jgi:hypothetical protein
MSQLIRFEDNYGMGDIVCLAQDLGPIDYNNTNVTSDTYKSDVFIQIGLSMGSVFSIDDTFIASISNKIDEIIFVYDMDSISGRGILTSQQLQKSFERHNRINKDIRLRYAPIVWSAETVALYTMLDIHNPDNIIKEKCIDITTLVHQKNTAKFHGVILDRILKHENINDVKVKHFSEYIKDKKQLIGKLTDIINEYPKGINKRTLQWITTADTKYLYDKDDAIQHQNDVMNLYNKYNPKDDSTFECYNEQLRLDKKCW